MIGSSDTIYLTIILQDRKPSRISQFGISEMHARVGINTHGS